MSPVTRVRLAKAAALGVFIGLLVGVATFNVAEGLDQTLPRPKH